MKSMALIMRLNIHSERTLKCALALLMKYVISHHQIKAPPKMEAYPRI